MNVRTREDGYREMLTGIGTERDPFTNLKFQITRHLSPEELNSIFVADGVGRRIVEGPAGEMIRPWFEVSGDNGEAISDRLEELGAVQTFTEAVTWARLHGGSVIVFALDDGREYDQPVGRVRKVEGAQVFDRWRVNFDFNSPSLNPVRRLRGLPQFIDVAGWRGERLRVHESRFEVITGLLAPQTIVEANSGWGLSVLEPAMDAITKYSGSLGYTTNILRDFVQAVLSVKDLSGLLAAGKEEMVRERLRLLDFSRSILNTMVIDADGEEYSKSASTVAGLDAVLDRMVEYLSMVTGIPTNKLVGRASPGLNATGEVELANYHDMLASERSRMVGRPAERYVELLHQELGEPESWSLKWNPFRQMTDTETAELRHKVAETDKIYIETGVLAPTEVADSRYGQGEWTMDTQLASNRDQLFEDIEEQQMRLAYGGQEEENERAQRTDATPRTLYVRRNVLNAAAIIKWAKEHGFETTLPAEDMHVTIAFSRTPVDWMALGESWQGKIELPPGGPRLMERFGEARVLLFASNELKYRHEGFLHNGASWDHSDYQPHITISYQTPNRVLEEIEPYQGEIVLGPEIFEEVNEKWLDGVKEDGWADQPRAPAGTSQGGQWTPAGGGYSKSGISSEVSAWSPPSGFSEVAASAPTSAVVSETPSFGSGTTAGKDYIVDGVMDEDAGLDYSDERGVDEYILNASADHKELPDYQDPAANKAVANYVNGSDGINASLRDGRWEGGAYEDDIRGIDAAMKPVSTDYITYRSRRSDPGHEVGDAIKADAYTSTAISPQVTHGDFGVFTGDSFYQYRIPKGYPAVVTNAGETEVLLPRGTRWQVVGKFSAEASGGISQRQGYILEPVSMPE